MNRLLRLASAALALAPLALSGGCGSDSNPVVPRPSPTPTLQNLWPNGDGAGWSYRLVQRTWQDTALHDYASEADVPAAPDMAELATLAGLQPIGPLLQADTARLTLRFAGTTTTGAGVTAQNLTSAMAGYPVPARVATRARLARARPDLAALLGPAGAAPARAALVPPVYFPTFLHGGAWRRDSAWVGTYSDFDTVPAFHYLRADLAPGAGYSMPVYPTLAPEVMLHVRVLPRRDVLTPAGRFRNTVAVLYLIDYGIGQSAGRYWRELDYGIIAYAAGVGPVWSCERFDVSAGAPLSLGGGDATLELTGTLP